jgi:citrate lyase subunit beta / citryl-CoA lyase
MGPPRKADQKRKRAMSKRPRRSWLLVLTADDRKVEKAAEGNADVLILDLSDSVTPQLKDMARQRVVDWFTSGHPFGDKQLVIKPNNLLSEWGRKDMEAFAPLAPAAIYYPEAKSAEEVQIVCDMLDAVGSPSEIAVLLETARSFVNIKELCTVRRVSTLCHAQGDLVVNLGATLTDSRETLLYTASQTVVYARAYGLDAIDTILPSNLRDVDLTRRYVEGSRRFGFTACSTFYAPHIDTINAVFSPTSREIENAKQILVDYEKVQQQGRAAYVKPDGTWITVHQYKQAKDFVSLYG